MDYQILSLSLKNKALYWIPIVLLMKCELLPHESSANLFGLVLSVSLFSSSGSTQPFGSLNVQILSCLEACNPPAFLTTMHSPLGLSSTNLSFTS